MSSSRWNSHWLTSALASLVGGNLSLGCVTFDSNPYEIVQAEPESPPLAESPEPVPPAPVAPSDPLVPSSPVAACPSFCQSGCIEASPDRIQCVIDCNAFDCRNAQFLCPVGVDCHLYCGEKTGACSDASLLCESKSECSATCSGKNSCENLHFTCSAIACDLSCEHKDSCKNAMLDCPSCSLFEEEDD